MSVAGLAGLGAWLLGREVGELEEDPAWLQSILCSASPLGTMLALGHGDRCCEVRGLEFRHRHTSLLRAPTCTFTAKESMNALASYRGV